MKSNDDELSKFVFVWRCWPRARDHTNFISMNVSLSNYDFAFIIQPFPDQNMPSSNYVFHFNSRPRKNTE